MRQLLGEMTAHYCRSPAQRNYVGKGTRPNRVRGVGLRLVSFLGNPTPNLLTQTVLQTQAQAQAQAPGHVCVTEFGALSR